jgi:hypothetical protein
MPVECHGNMEGEERTEFSCSRPYETGNPVASGVQTVTFSEKKSTLSNIPEYYQNLAKQQNRDSGSGSSTLKTHHSQERDATREEPDSRRYIGVKADKSNIRLMHQEINMISITREYHVFLSEAYQPIPTEEVEPIKPMIDKQAMDSPECEKWHEAKELENAALAQKKVMVLV